MRRRRRTNPGKSIFYLLVIIVAALLTRGGQYNNTDKHSNAKHSSATYKNNLAMGNPGKAVSKSSCENNYLIINKCFALSYNNSKGTPNWVSWRLTKYDMGNAERSEFYPYTDLPDGFQKVRPSDYTGSGFDRGHMCPHADRNASVDMSRETFAMINIIPQSPEVNGKAWRYMESYCRELAQQGKILYIVAGPYGKGGVGRNGYYNKIGRDNTVIVPSRCWKVVMVLNEGPGDDIKKITPNTRLIAVIMPNNMNVNDDWGKYRVSVAQVEKLTGYKFFDKAPANIINPLKLKVDKTPIIMPSSERYGY